MTPLDIIGIAISIVLFIKGAIDGVWWIRFKMNARFTDTGIVVYKIEEKNVK